MPSKVHTAATNESQPPSSLTPLLTDHGHPPANGQAAGQKHGKVNNTAKTLASVADYLACLQVVMVNTTLPANIGSAARAMHTMGLSHLTVVDPKLPIDDTSVAHAAGGTTVLEQATITDTLSEALAACQLVFAASSRSRHLPRPVVTPSQAADIMLRFIEQQSQPRMPNTPLGAEQSTVAQHPSTTTPAPTSIAIVFGREDRGLTNEELALADYHIQIQANPQYPVLNVASAVQVIASFIFAQIQDHLDQAAAEEATQDQASLTPARSGASTDSTHQINHELNVFLRQVWDEPAITHAQAQQLTDRLTELMVQLRLANPEHLRALPQRLSRLTSRLQLDQKEYQLLSAVLAKLTP